MAEPDTHISRRWVSMGLRRAAVGCALVVAFLISASANLACSASVHFGSDSQGSSGYRTVRAENAGFSLAIPGDWLALNLDGKNPEEALMRFRETTKLTGVGAFYTDDPATVVAKGFKLYGLKPAGDKVHSEVVVQLLPGASSAPREQDVRGAVTAGGGQDLQTKETRIAGVPAIEAAFFFEAGDLHAHETAYFLRGPEGGLAITFNSKDDGRKNKTVQTMIHSLKLLR
jgi:hypothetical protein